MVFIGLTGVKKFCKVNNIDGDLYIASYSLFLPLSKIRPEYKNISPYHRT